MTLLPVVVELSLVAIWLVVLSVSPLSASWSASASVLLFESVVKKAPLIRLPIVVEASRVAIRLVVLSVSPLSASWSASASVLVFESVVV